MGVVSEKLSTINNHYVPAFLKAHKMEPFFKDIGMSGRTGMDKGRNIRLLMERNGVENAYYTGDTTGDEKASGNAGIPFVWVEYGFGEAKTPDATIAKITDLPELLGTV